MFYGYLMKISFALLLMGSIFITGVYAQSMNEFSAERDEMVLAIKKMVRDTSAYIGKSSLNASVVAAIANVPRHEFVPEELRSYAYENRPLPIGNGQTISQPYIVALMTDLANINENSIVLEIGTGSGYQAAVLAELAKQVYSIEIIERLGITARQKLLNLGYQNTLIRIGNGYHGWQEHAPFDAILVTAAPEEIPQPLIEQLKPGGRMIIPVGPQNRTQSLQVIEKKQDGTIDRKDVLPVGFVPFTGDH